MNRNMTTGNITTEVAPENLVGKFVRDDSYEKVIEGIVMKNVINHGVITSYILSAENCEMITIHNLNPSKNPIETSPQIQQAFYDYYEMYLEEERLRESIIEIEEHLKKVHSRLNERDEVCQRMVQRQNEKKQPISEESAVAELTRLIENGKIKINPGEDISFSASDESDCIRIFMEYKVHMNSYVRGGDYKFLREKDSNDEYPSNVAGANRHVYINPNKGEQDGYNSRLNLIERTFFSESFKNETFDHRIELVGENKRILQYVSERRFDVSKRMTVAEFSKFIAKILK